MFINLSTAISGVLLPKMSKLVATNASSAPSSTIFTDPNRSYFLNYGAQGSSTKTGIYSCVIVPGETIISNEEIVGFEIEIYQPDSSLSSANAVLEKIWVYDKLVCP